MTFTHLTADGQAHMVDVTAKQPTVRQATASAKVRCSSEVLTALTDQSMPKGDVFAVCRIAGIQAAKRVPDLIPLAHTIGVHGVQVDVAIVDDGVEFHATVRTADRTGVEMEALSSVTVAALACIDMIKGKDRLAYVEFARVESKSGGRSGDWSRSS